MYTKPGKERKNLLSKRKIEGNERKDKMKNKEGRKEK
jgi:hypothetical protein